jgi:hypothetical protein
MMLIIIAQQGLPETCPSQICVADLWQVLQNLNASSKKIA